MNAMVLDAVGAEALKLRRSRALLLLGFGAVPVGILAVFLAIASQFSAIGGIPGLASDPASVAARALGAAGYWLALVFYAVAAAGIFASDYRHETFRLVVPRVGRTPLILAKYAVFLGFMLASLALVALAGALAALYGPLLGRAPLMPPPAGIARTLIAAFLPTFLQTAAVGGVAAFLAVLTRSIAGALLPLLVFMVLQPILAALYDTERLWEWTLLLPSVAADRLAAGLLGGTTAETLAGAGALVGVAAVSLAATLVLFSGRDLSRE